MVAPSQAPRESGKEGVSTAFGMKELPGSHFSAECTVRSAGMSGSVGSSWGVLKLHALLCVVLAIGRWLQWVTCNCDGRMERA